MSRNNRKGPFKDIDDYILKGLKDLGKEVTAVYPGEDIASLATATQPELLLYLEGKELPIEQLSLVRNLGIRTALWTGDDPYIIDQIIGITPHFDFIFTNEWNCVKHYKEAGCPHVYFLPLAACAETFHPYPVNPRYQSDICFIGNGFRSRRIIFHEIAPFLATKDVIIIGNFYEKMKSFELIKGKIRTEWISSNEAANYYNGAKIVMNMHRSHKNKRNSKNIRSLTINPRTFEVNACSAFQLTDYRPNLTNFYIPGEEIAVWHSPQDLVEKLEYYLHHESKRRKIAYKGYQRTLKENTYTKRLSRLIEIVEMGNIRNAAHLNTIPETDLSEEQRREADAAGKTAPNGETET